MGTDTYTFRACVYKVESYIQDVAYAEISSSTQLLNVHSSVLILSSHPRQDATMQHRIWAEALSARPVTLFL